MGYKYEQLTLEERYSIARLREDGQSLRHIAATLARAPSTIAREIRRNTVKTKGYDPGYAQIQTAGRRWHGSRMERQPALQQAVLDRLAMGWSPQQVAGRLALEHGRTIISHESIYRFIDAQIRRTKDYRWRHYLPRAKSKRGWRGRKGGSSALFIKHRRSIHERPASACSRKQPGHWEADLMLFAAYGQAALVTHERSSRFTVVIPLQGKAATPLAHTLDRLLASLPKPMKKSMTFDNGTEFAEHYRMHAQGVQTFFCDVRSPWQKGGIENAIGRLRRNLPRKTDLSTLTMEDITCIAQLYNHTPRKCLDFKTPAEVFLNQLLHFKCETTSLPTQE